MYSRQSLNEIAVPDALPLWECWRELSETYESVELDPSDYVPEQLATYELVYRGIPEGKDQWVLSCIMQDKAKDTLRSAIGRGDFPIYYIADNQQPAPLASPSLNGKEISLGKRFDLNAGRDGRESATNRALLWVKKTDWAGFLSGLLPGTGTTPVEFWPRQQAEKCWVHSLEVSGVADWLTASDAVTLLGTASQTEIRARAQQGLIKAKAESVIITDWVHGESSRKKTSIPSSIWRMLTEENWDSGSFQALWIGSTVRMAGVMFARADIEAMIPSGRMPTAKNGRAPAVKTAAPPNDDAIKAKADEMKARGLDGRAIAATMRHEPGFEHAGTVTVREAIKGRYARGRQSPS